MAITKIKLYNGEVEIFFDSLRHKYTLEDGAEIISVTQTLSILAKPALINWAAGQAADYIAATLKPGVAYDELEIQAMVEAARKAHWIKKTTAGSRGSFIHRFVEQTIKGENPTIPVNEDLRESCQHFLDWTKERKVKFLASEQIVFSKEFQFVGTLDFICQIDGKLYIGDLKSGSAIYPEFLCQASAYRFCRTEEFPSEIYSGILIIRIGREGDVEFRIIEGDDDYFQLFDAFKDALDLTRAMEKVKLIK